MPTYPYKCKTCTNTFDVYKFIADLDRKETCPKCESYWTERYIAKVTFYGASDWDQAKYDPAFGKVIRNAKHREREAKQRGWIEVGNEPVDNLIKMQDANQKKIADDTFERDSEGLVHGLKKAMGKI